MRRGGRRRPAPVWTRWPGPPQARLITGEIFGNFIQNSGTNRANLVNTNPYQLEGVAPDDLGLAKVGSDDAAEPDQPREAVRVPGGHLGIQFTNFHSLYYLRLIQVDTAGGRRDLVNNFLFVCCATVKQLP